MEISTKEMNMENLIKKYIDKEFVNLMEDWWNKSYKEFLDTVWLVKENTND